MTARPPKAPTASAPDLRHALATLSALGDTLGRHELRMLAAGFDQRKPDARDRAEAALARIAAEIVEMPDRPRTPGGPGWAPDGRRARLLARLRAVQALLHEHRHRNLARPADVHAWVEDEYGGHPGRVMWRGVDLGPTPETLAQVAVSRVAPIPALRARGQIGDDHVRAAAELAAVVEGMTRRLDARCASLEGAGGRGWTDDVPARVAETWSMVYLPWARLQKAGEAAGRRHLGITLAVVVGGCSVASARLAARMGYDRALAVVVGGLEDWADMASEVRAPVEEV